MADGTIMSMQKKIRRLMEAQGYSVEALAKSTNISIGTLKRLRKLGTEANPTFDVLMKVASALGITIKDLIDEEKETVTQQNQWKEISADNINELPDDAREFVVIIKKPIFSLKTGTKLLFKRYSHNTLISKYIIVNNGKVLKRDYNNPEELVFSDENGQVVHVSPENIIGCILKEFYEAEYA